MKTNLFSILVVFAILLIAGCKKTDSECPPQWYFGIDETGIPEEANPEDSIIVSFREYLNEETESTAPVLYYFEVPTIFKNPKGDIGCYVSKSRRFYYQLKDPDNPPYSVTMEMKTINECTQDYKPQYFTIVYDTIP